MTRAALPASLLADQFGNPSDESPEESAPTVSRAKAKPFPALARKIREARLARGLSIRALGKEAGLSFRHISLLEGGRVKNPTVETLRRLSAALGLLLEDLVRED